MNRYIEKYFDIDTRHGLIAAVRAVTDCYVDTDRPALTTTVIGTLVAIAVAFKTGLYLDKIG